MKKLQQEKIKIKVENGNVLLEGEVEWEFERTNAKTAVENLTGVRSVINLITIQPKTSPADIQKKINSAFHRSASMDAANISAEVVGSKVILRGKVRSLAEKEDAVSAVWNAPGVRSVDNRLDIEIPQLAF